ncbi:DUF975 family protein [Fictibacillus phosphorivorans]|uniref:DUF975 family protein n=1 Tax=Fictibacillus phosphorivorans TaxID=1221500 RepID=UPI00203F53DA|nr:DUF975 family protein [Fictibacillus phosphorivorans]MCM3717609.1 DUF975 family protein [Fictibacillus phosphorivorans]MCM3775509.1 DUF975 family protein [Fictibacillus phosphorivorans]
MKSKTFKKEAKQQLKGQWGRAAIFTLFFGALYYVIPLLIEINQSGGFENWLSTDPSEGTQASTFIVTLVLLPLYVGYLWTFLSVVRTGERIKFSSLFQAFSEISMYLKLLGTYLLTMVYLFFWFLLLVVPGIIKAFAYSQTYFVLKDNPEIGINAAITKSRKLMHGYKWKYFVLQLSFIGWILLSIITLGIGFIWLSPYLSTANAAFYNELVKRQSDEEEAA